ncbi:unnamed protein product [Amaranthus hypochondriacus]
MEDNQSINKLWKFNTLEENTELQSRKKNKKPLTVRGALSMLNGNVNPIDKRTVIPLAHGDPSPFDSFRASADAEDSVVTALRSASFNGYPTTFGLPSTRKAVADYVSKDVPYKVSLDDVYLTSGCKHAIQAAISAIAFLPNSNILLPRPTFALYDAIADFYGLQVRHYNLLQERNWEIDIGSVQDLADDNTVAVVVINPGNPTGSVYSYQHLQNVAEAARKLGLVVIADEVYEHIVFGRNPFVRMAVFASLVPVLTLSSLSKRWIVPGWRVGWLVTTDPNGVLQKSQFIERIKSFLIISSEPSTFIQAAVPEIIEKVDKEFFSKCINVLQQDADMVFDKLADIPYITCPYKPEGSMFLMVKLNISMLEGIHDDTDFCMKLANQEKVIILPGSTVGMENWLRITFAIEPPVLEEGLERVKVFCQRNAKA